MKDESKKIHARKIQVKRGSQAEKELGGGTGQIKLRYVYDMFVTKFPVVSNFVTFETFSYMVDEALIKMRHLLETNEKIEAYVDLEEK